MSGIVVRFHRGPFPGTEPLGLLRLGMVALGGYSSPLSATAGLVFAASGNVNDSTVALSGLGGLRYVCAGALRGRSRPRATGALRFGGLADLVADVSPHVLAGDAIIGVFAAGGITNVPVSRHRGPYPILTALGLMVLGDTALVGPFGMLQGRAFRVFNTTGTGAVISPGIRLDGDGNLPGVVVDDNYWLLFRRKEDN